MIDEVDRLILELLQKDGRTSNAELARRVGMAPSAVFERVRRLEQRRVIQGYVAKVDPRAVGRSLLAFVLVRSDEPTGEMTTGRALADLPDVLEVHHVAGQDSYLVKLRVKDPESLGRLLRERFGSIPNVRATQSTIALETVKEDWAVPIEEAPPPARERLRA